MSSGKASWTTGSSTTSPPLPTSCGPQVAPPQSAWAPVRPGVSVSLTLCASPSARPSPSHPETSGMISTLTWMLGATSNNVSKKRASELGVVVQALPIFPSAYPLFPLPHKALLLDQPSLPPSSSPSSFQSGFLREGEIRGYLLPNVWPGAWFFLALSLQLPCLQDLNCHGYAEVSKKAVGVSLSGRELSLTFIKHFHPYSQRLYI